MFRKDYQKIRDDALELSESVENLNWKRVYQELASVADKLDAMEARTQANTPQETPKS